MYPHSSYKVAESLLEHDFRLHIFLDIFATGSFSLDWGYLACDALRLGAPLIRINLESI